MNFRERNEKQREEQSRAAKVFVWNNAWLVGNCPGADHGHPQGALPGPGTDTVPPQGWEESSIPFYTRASSLGRTASKPWRSALSLSGAPKSENVFAPKLLHSHLQKSLSTYSRSVIAMQQQIIYLQKKMLLPTSRFQRCIWMGVTATFRSNDEVQIKPDLKSILDVCILDIKFIYMHKEIRMLQVLTSKRSALLHKNVLFTLSHTTAT